jgi:hypothetical protein
MPAKGLIVESENGTRMQRDEAVAKLEDYESELRQLGGDPL